ncbi:MAG: hypothetical protein GF370_01945 [Candidatus Nealsonbacteria bacterium]|nr:hypothetical protein [Candidatus Nealsonbacteria bacterium]
MPYKRFKKTLFKKVGGKWTKKHTYRSAKQAKDAKERLEKEEQRKKAKAKGK